jgi:hypothetical protein
MSTQCCAAKPLLQAAFGADHAKRFPCASAPAGTRIWRLCHVILLLAMFLHQPDRWLHRRAARKKPDIFAGPRAFVR